MKKLLLSVLALMVATLLFSQDDSGDKKEGVSQDNNTELVKDADNAN